MKHFQDGNSAAADMDWDSPPMAGSSFREDNYCLFEPTKRFREGNSAAADAEWDSPPIGGFHSDEKIESDCVNEIIRRKTNVQSER